MKIFSQILFLCFLLICRLGVAYNHHEVQLPKYDLSHGCMRPPQGPPGPTGPTGACFCPDPIFCSYSLPYPPGAFQIDTYEPIPFTSDGLNANFPSVGGIVLNDTTSIFTIPVDGYYEISYGFSSAWNSGAIVGLGIFVANVFSDIVSHSSIPQGIGAQYQMTSGNLIIPLTAGTQIALINTNILPLGGSVPTDYVALLPYPALETQEQSAAYITFKKVGDL
jgi:hypothetical protein